MFCLEFIHSFARSIVRPHYLKECDYTDGTNNSGKYGTHRCTMHLDHHYRHPRFKQKGRIQRYQLPHLLLEENRDHQHYQQDVLAPSNLTLNSALIEKCDRSKRNHTC